MPEIIKMAFFMKCPGCGLDDSWSIKLDGGSNKWTKILGFECECGHYVYLNIPVEVVR